MAALTTFLPDAVSVDHIGSTAVPGLAAKDCLDVMIQVRDLATAGAADALERRAYRRRPEPWNQQEISYGIVCPKQVFAPPPGTRSCNLHIREHGGANVRYALLFRDYMRADAGSAQAWGQFKARLAETVTDLASYGQIKAPAQEILMQSAERLAPRQRLAAQPELTDRCLTDRRRLEHASTHPAAKARRAGAGVLRRPAGTHSAKVVRRFALPTRLTTRWQTRSTHAARPRLPLRGSNLWKQLSRLSAASSVSAAGLERFWRGYRRPGAFASSAPERQDYEP